MRSLLCGLRKEPSISSLAKNRKFDEIVSKLKSKDTESLCSWLGIVPSGSDGIDDPIVCSLALHQVMLQRPPVAVAELLIQTMKDLKPGHIPEAAVDEKSQTALHIAVEVGCDISVIQCLTATTDLPAFTMDVWGRFPLHIACASGPRRGRGMMTNTVQTINHLLEIYPQAVIVPDLSGKTPLQLVQNRGSAADKRILLTLRMVQNLLRKTETPSVAKTASSTTEEEVPDDMHRLVMKYITSTCALCDDDLSSVGSRGVSRGRPHASEVVEHCEV
jgi:hypothetical protein